MIFNALLIVMLMILIIGIVLMIFGFKTFGDQQKALVILGVGVIMFIAGIDGIM